MLRISVKSKLKTEEAVKRAVAFFGPGGYGLTVEEQTDDSVYLRGGGGGVVVTTGIEKKGSSVELVSREWDYQVKEFIDTIK